MTPRQSRRGFTMCQRMSAADAQPAPIARSDKYFLTLDTIVLAGFRFVLLVWVARVVGSGEYWRQVLPAAIEGVFGALITALVVAAPIAVAPGLAPGQRRSVIRVCTRRAWVWGAGGGAAGFALALTPALELGLLGAAGFGLTLALGAVAGVRRSARIIEFETRPALITDTCAAATGLGLFAALRFTGLDPVAAFWLSTAAAHTVVVLGLHQPRTQVEEKLRPDVAQRLSGVAGSLAAVSLVGAAASRLQPGALAPAGARVVSEFGSSMLMVSPIRLGVNTLLAVLQPRLAHAINVPGGSGQGPLTWRSAGAALAIGVATSAVCALLGTALCRWVLGPDYMHIGATLWIAALAITFEAVSSVLASALTARGEEPARRAALARCVASVLQLLGVLPMGWLDGLGGVFVAIGAVELLLVATLAMWCRAGHRSEPIGARSVR